MENEGKIGLREAIVLIIITIVPKAFFTSPALVAKFVGTAGWYMTIISGLVAMLGFMFAYLLIKRYPNNNLMEIYDNVLGKVAGSLFSFALSAFLLIQAAINISEFIHVNKVYTFPQTPDMLLTVFFIAAVAVFSFYGLETIARYANLVSGMLLLGFGLIIALSFQNFEYERIYPLFGYGIMETVKHGIMRNSAYGEVIIIPIIAKSLQKINDIKKAGVIGTGVACLIIATTVLIFNMTFPYYIGMELIAPMYVMTSLIKYGLVLTRVESLFLFLWSISSIISISVQFYCSIMVYCHVFKITDRRPLIIPFLIILFSLAMIPSGIIIIISKYVQILRTYGGPVIFLPPFIALIVSLFKKSGGKVENA